MNRRGRPPVFALTTFSLLAVMASVALAFLAAEVFNIGAPPQVVGPNATDVLAMDVFLADNPVQDVKIMPGERASALGDNISYFDFTNGFAGYVNAPVVAGDPGTPFPANTIFADRGNPGDNVPTGQDDQNIGDEFWEDLNTDGFYNAGETEVWWEVEPVDGTRGFDLRAWATAVYGFNPANDEIYFKGGPAMNANAPMWIDFNEDGPANTFEWEDVIFPAGGGGSGLDGTAADVTGPTFGDTPQNEVWGDINGDMTFDPVNDVIWDDDRANSLYDDEPVINGAPTHGDAGTAFPANVMFENEDLDDVWEPLTGEDLFEDTNANNQWDVGETIFTGGLILPGAPGVSLASLSPAYMFVDNGPAGFDFPGDDIFIDTNGSAAYEQETMMLGAAPPNGTPGTAFQNGWSFSTGWTLIWDDADGNSEYDADLVVFGAPKAHPGDPAPAQPTLYNGGEEIFVDNIPPAIGFTGLLSLDPDEQLNMGADGPNAAHGAPLTFFPDPEADGFERYADATVPIGEYNDGDEIFEDHDNSMTYTAQADGIVGGDDGPDPVTWNVGDPLPAPAANLAYLDLNFDGLLSDDEPVVTESIQDNLTMDFGESVIPNFSGPLTAFPDNVYMIDINGDGDFQGGEPIFENTNVDDIADPGENSLRSSVFASLIPMTPFLNVEYFIGGLADYNDGDDIIEVLSPQPMPPADGDMIYNFYGPDGIPGVGGDDILWADTDDDGILELSQDVAFMDRNNNRRLDGGTESPAFVIPGDGDLGDPIVPIIPFNFAFNDMDGSVTLSIGLEPVYVDANTNGVVNAGDVRIFYHQPNATVGVNDEDVAGPVASFSNLVAPGPAQTIFLDNVVVNGTWDAGEPVYYYSAGFTGGPNPALVSSDAVGADVIRLNEAVFTTGTVAHVYPPLSLVHDGDQDLVAPGANFEYFPPTAAFGGVTYYDGNTNGVYNPGELVYLDVGLVAVIDAGDARIYSYPDGSTVAAFDADVGVALNNTLFAPGDVAVRDGWGGTPNAYDPGEQIYGAVVPGRYAGYSPGSDGFDGYGVTAGLDVRLTNRPFEWSVIDGGGFVTPGQALAPMTEDLVPNGTLDANLDETALDETALGVDLNQDGDMADTAVIWDINGDNNVDLVVHEDQNYDGVLTGPEGNHLFTRTPFNPVVNRFFPVGIGGPYFTPSQNVFRIIRDGAIADVLPGDAQTGHIKAIGGLIKHCDDGGRGYNPNFPPLYDGAGNLRYDDGEVIIFDSDDDLRWDPGEAILTASAMPIDPATSAILVGAFPAVQPMNGFGLAHLPAPTNAYIFADVQGGVANGLYDTEEAIIADGTPEDGRWNAGELVVLSSGDGHLSDWTIERRAPAGNDFVLDWDGGGTWSDGPDTPRDLVDGVINTAEADPLTTFAPDIGYHNVLGVGEYDDFENDEIFRDLDGDGYVTLQQDVAVYPQAGPFASANGDALNQFVAVPPAPAGANRFAGWVDTGNGVYDGDGGDEEDIYYDTDGDGVVDELDDVMTDFALVNPLSANEPTDIVAVNLWMEDGTTSGFQPTEDVLVGQGTVDPMDSRSWTWTGLSVPVPSEDRNGDGDDDDVLDESVWSMDFNGDGDLLDVVTEAHPDGRASAPGPTECDSQTRMYASIDISADPQNLLIGNQFDATIPIDGVQTLALNNGPSDMTIANSMGLSGGVITIDDYPPTVTRLEQLWLNDFDSDSAPGVQPPDVIGIYGHANNIWEVSGTVEMVFRTPSDNDVRRVKLLMANDEAGPWTALDTDPNHGLDIGSDGEPGIAGVDDDGDWVAATDDVGADGIALTGDAGEGNGVPDAGEPGVDRNDPEVAAAILNPLNDGVDNNDDGYIDDFEFEPAGMDVDRDGLVGEGFPEANQTDGIDNDGDGIIDDDGVDVNGNGIFGEPDPTVGPGGDSDYLTMYMYDNDEDGIADSDETQYMAQLINDNFWVIPDSTLISFTGSPTMWSFTLNTLLMQYVLNGSATLPAYNDMYVKAVAYDQFGNVMPLYAAPTALRLDNLAPAATVAMTDMQGTAVNDGDQILDSETYMVGVTSPDDELYLITIDWAKNDEATFGNHLGVIQDVNETLPWSPDPVGNNPPDDTDDYYWEARGSDILGWFNGTTQQWQPYAFDLDGNPATDPEFIGNVEVSALPTCHPAIVTTCLTAADVAELHVEALNATAPLSAITRIEASPTEIRAAGDFADGVRVPAYNAILLFVDNEDINENGSLDTALHEATLNGIMDNVDYNKDGVIDAGDIGAFDLNQDGDMVDIINEDANGNGWLDDGIDDGDGQWWTSDIVGCVFEQRAVNDTNWVPIQTVTGDTVGGVVQDLSYPVAVGWDTRALAGSEKSYNLRVRSWDVEDNWLDEGIEIVTVTVDATGLNAYFNQDPSEVTDPTIDGSTVFGTINLYAYSVDPTVTRVLFRYSDDAGATWNDITVDDNPDAGFGADPTVYTDWATTFDTSAFPDGDYLFDVVGLDEFGNSDEDPTDMGQQIAVTFMNTAPVVAITSPAAGTIVSALNGNMLLDLQAELQPTAAAMNGLAAGSGEIEAQFQYSIDAGATWSSIDGINSEAGSSTLQPGDYFADNPRIGLRMGAWNRHPIVVGPLPLWMGDMIYRKAVENTDYSQVEVGDRRITGVPWTDPMYGPSTTVAEGDQDIGTPLTPFVGPVDGGDAVDPAPERFGPFTTTFVTNLVLGDSQMEMAADKVVLLRVKATDVASGLVGYGPATEITVRENSDPVVDVIEVTDSSGGLVLESDDTDYTTLNQFPDGFTFDDQITVFARAMDNSMTFTDQQGTVAQCQVFYRPRQVDYSYTGPIGWTAGPVDTEYPFIIDVDISGLNGLYEFGVQATDEGGNTSGIYPQFSCVIDHMSSTATADGGFPAEINEGATFTVGATATAGPIDGTVPYEARFWASSVVMDEAVTPEFQASGPYAGFFTAMTTGDIVDDQAPTMVGVDPGTGGYDSLVLDGRDVRVDVGGTPGVFHTFADLQAMASPTIYDFAIDYSTNEVIFAADPTSGGDVAIDYHNSGWIQFGTDQSAPFTADWTPNFGQSGTYDMICSLWGTQGADSPTSGLFTRPVALSGNPGWNVEPAYAEWNVLTVNDAVAPMFTAGGLGRLSTDDLAFADRWNAVGGGPINLGNAVNLADEGPETVVSGDELDLAIYETGEELDPASLTWAIRDGSDVLVSSGAFTAVESSPYEHPITFTLFENDFAQVVEGDEIENVRVWLDFNGDNNWESDQAEVDAEVFPLADMGDYWQTTVNFDSQTNVEYMFLVDTIGNDLDFNNDGVEDPVDDPRNQNPAGAGIEIDQNNGGAPSDSRIDMSSAAGYWANVDISSLPDGVYFFDFTADDMTGNTTTVTKRVIVDRTPFPQDFITVSTGDEVYAASPGTEVTLFAKIVDPAVPDVNINDAIEVAFQYFDGVDWLWINGGAGNTSANAIDTDPSNGWSRTWTVPNPATDSKDNDGDGFVDETDEGEFTTQLRAVVHDFGFNLSHTGTSGLADFTIDSIAPETYVALAQTAADATPTPAEGKVVTLGEWVDLFAPEPTNEAAEAVVFQWSTNPNATTPVWNDIDCTPLDPDDDFMGFETPDFAADDVLDSTNYYKCRLETELIRHALAASGDLFAEVRARGIDAVGNVAAGAQTAVLVMNDTEGPLTVIFGFDVPPLPFRYANDPALALGGSNVTVWTRAVGYDYIDVATTTLQVSLTGGGDWSEWTTVGTAQPDISGNATFAFDATQYPDGTLYMRAFSTDKDGNMGGDANGNGIIDSDEASSVHTIAVMIDNGIPTMALMQAGAYGPGAHFGRSPVDGDILMADLLPRETQFMPVLPTTVTFAAWNPSDESPDVLSCELQFFDDVSDPGSPAWVTIAYMDYRDDPGDYGPAGAPADGFWRTEFASVPALYSVMQMAVSGSLGAREYRFRALVTSYSGITNHDDPGVSLMVDADAPSLWDIALGNVEMEGGGGGWNMPALHVAGGDLVPIQGYVPDSWAEWIPGSGGGNPPHDPEMAWESAGIYGVRARVRSTAPGEGWQTVGLMTLDPTANLPATYVTSWTAPLNVAATDTMYDVEIAARDSAGNYVSDYKEDGLVVQDRTPPDGTEITNIFVADGADGATFPDPVTETTIREEGTQVRGEVTLVAATAAGDASITPDALVYFEVKPDGGDWIMINAGDTTAVMPGVTMEADFLQGPGAGGVHLGQLWKSAWNTRVTDGDGAAIFPDGHYVGRAWCVDIWGNAELLDDVDEIDIWVDNTAPMAEMDADPYTTGVQTTATVERNDVFTAFARTILEGGAEDTSDDATLEFMMKLSTDMNVPGSWTALAPGYDATDVNPDATRPYSFDWWMNQNSPPLAVGAQYNIAANTSDLLGNSETAVEGLDDGRGITITIVDTQAPVATITKLVRSIGDPTVITWPDEVCIVGIDSLEATILRGDTDTKFVRFYYRPEGGTEWILADGDIVQMGDLTWVLYNWDSSGLPEGRYEFMARAEDDAGNVADGPAITLIINRTGPVFVAVSPESDALPVWEPSLSAPSSFYSNPGTPIQIGPVGPQPYADGRMTPTGSYTGSDSRTYTVTITGAGNAGQATFDWSATGSGGSGSGTTGDMVELEDGILVSFCDGTDTPSFEVDDEFTFTTEGKTVDLVVTTDVGMDDIDPSRVFFEYKRSDLPDVDENWQRDAISPCGVLHDDMLNTWSSKWDISGLESCLYDIRLTMWDKCGNWTTAMVAEKVIVDNECPVVAITNIENADKNDTTLEPIDFGQITDVTRGVPVEIWATATDDEPCLPADHETGVDVLQFQMSGQVAGGGQADVLFLLDGSGSMSAEIANAKAAMGGFATALGSAGVDFTLGLVDLGSTPGPGKVAINFTSDVGAFQTAVNNFTSSGAMASYDALTGALSGVYGLNWRAGAKKFMILVSDTSPEWGTASGVNFCSTPNPAEESALIATIGNQAVVHAIVETPANDTDGCPEDNNAFDGITSSTGGALWDLNASDWTPLMSQIAGQIAGAVAGGWRDLGLYEVPDNAGDDPDVTASQLWDTSGLDEGTYYLRVLAYDDAGNNCYSQTVQVNVIDKTPPTARIAGFDPDVLHGDDENTLERVYALVYSDDEIEDVQFQYLLPGATRWVTFGIGFKVDAGGFDPLEQNNVPEIWASDFNLSDLIALTNVGVGGQFTLRAVAKDSDSNRIDDYRSDRNSPELDVTVVTSPIDGSLALCPARAASRITDMSMGSPREDNVLVSVSTDAVDEVPRTLVVWEDLTGVDTAAILPMSRTPEIPSSTFQGNVSLSGVMAGGEVSIFATAIQTGGTPAAAIHMATKNLVVHPVDDALGSNGVVSVPRTNACMTAGALGASVEVPPGNGQSGGLYIGPADLDVPRTSEAQSYYIERYGQAYYIDLFGGSDDFNPGYEAEVVLTYDDAEGLDETLLAPRYWGEVEDDGGYPSLPGVGFEADNSGTQMVGMWLAEGISHVKVDTEANEVSFVIDNLVDKNFFSLFTPTGDAPITVTDYIPWSVGYTDHDPEIKAMLYDIFGAGIDESSVEVYIDGNIVANYGTGWSLGNGDLDLNQVNPDGTKYELIYTHSTIGDPHFQNEKGGDLLDPGMHQLMITYKNLAGESFVLDPAASLATFGVDDTPVRYWWDPGTAENGTPLDFVLGRDPKIKVKIWDLESGIHIQDTWVGNQGTGELRDGIKMDVYKVETGRYDPDGPGDTYYSRNLIQTATPDMLVFDPPIDEYDPAVDDTLTITYPMYNVNLDAWNSQELEVVIYTQRETYSDPDFDDSVNNYDLAVMDLVGNAGSPFVQHRFRIDVCGPTVEFVTPECGSTVDPEEDVIVTANLTDECALCTGGCGDDAVFEGSGVDVESIRYEVMTPADTATTGRDAKIEDGRITFTLPGPLQLGEHTLTVWVSDVLGNETQAECSFTATSDDRLLADAYVYPNPLDPSDGGGTFVVNAGQAGAKVSIDVFDFAGNFVATVAHNRKVTSWGFEIPWDGRAEDGTMLASGPYMARVRVENEDDVMSRTVKVMVWQLDHF